MLKLEKKGRAQIKSQNRIRVFRELLKNGELSRTQLEKNLHLSAPSVSRVVDTLIRDGIVREVGTEVTTLGRKPVLLQVRLDTYYTIGINIAKSKLFLCIMNLGNQVLFQSQMNITDIKTGQDLLPALHLCLQEALENSRISKEQLFGIGIASRGIVDQKNGVVLRLRENMKDVKIREYLADFFECPILVENNIEADLEYEYIQNPTFKDKDLIYLYLGEGVGGSFITNGQMMAGESNMAGKIAHLPVVSGGRVCSCGKRGHLEAYLGKSALEEEYRRLSGRDEEISIQEICRRANEGEQAAVRLLDDALDKLAIGITQLLVVINPGILLLSGDLFDYYPGVLDQLKDKVTQSVFNDTLTQIQWLVKAKANVQIEQSMASLTMEKALHMLEE